MLNYIIDYLNFLYKYGLTVTLHGSISICEELVPYFTHQNPYCHFIKSLQNVNICAFRQGKVYDRCRYGEFFGTCFAGVSEFVYPLSHKNNIVGFVSVGGYLSGTEESRKKVAHFSEKYHAELSTLEELQRQYLKKSIPDKKSIDALIHPLIFMLEAYYDDFDLKRVEYDTVNRLMLNYISENYHNHITMQTLAEHLNFSVSSLSHIFKKNCAKSLPEYILSLRLNEAKTLLKESNTSIIEISSFLGFSSSNYFSTVFKKHFGITPRQYRTKHTWVYYGTK